jgi:transcriptional regulator with XRE-family HTH domain
MNPKLVYKHIGDVIRQRRKQLGLRQHHLAAKLGISRGSLANIEIGAQGVLVHQLYKFGAALNLPATDFLPLAFEKDESEWSNDWENVMPADLSPQQKSQIAALLDGDGTATKKKGGRDAK